jgi:hypothetical protein
MIDRVEQNDSMPLINQYLTTDDNIRFKTYAITTKDPELFTCLHNNLDFKLID